MAFKLSLSKFKKVSSDKDHTVMRDGKGNEIKVAHKMLTPALKEQLDGLPVHLAQGGMVKSKKYADEVEQPQAPVVVNVNPAPPQSANAAEAMQNAYQAAADAPTPPKQAVPIPADAMGKAYATDYNKDAVAPAPPAMAPQPAQDALQASQAAASSPTPQAPTQRAPGASASAEMPSDQPKQGLDIMDAYNTGTRGLDEQAKAEAAAAAEHAAALKQSIKWSQDFETTTKQQMADTSKEIQNAINDFQNSHITPQKLFANTSTAGKILGIIGLALGGGGAAAAHQDPALMRVLTNEIDRDVKAQEAEMGKKQNLIGAYQHKFQNIKDAADMTRLVHAGIVAQQIDQAAVKQGGPLAAARRSQALSALQKEYYPLQIQLAMRRAVANFAQDPNGAGGGTGRIDAMLNNLRVTNPEMAKEMEQRYVPGVGIGSIPVPNEARGSISAKQQLDSALKDLSKWSVKHEGSMDPAIINEGKTKAAEIQSMYRNAINGGVFKKGEQEFIDNIIDSDPTKFFNKLRIAPKLKAVLETNQAQLNNLKQNYGLPTQQPGANLSPLHKTYVDWARSNPKDPRAAIILQKLQVE